MWHKFRQELGCADPQRKKRFTAAPEFLEREIGLTFDAQIPKHCVHVFFQRYLGEKKEVEYYYDTSQLDTGEVIARLVTPFFYDRECHGPSQCGAQEATVAVAKIFIQDLQVQRAAALLPPAVEKMRRHVTKMLEEPGMKASLCMRGVDIKRLTQDAVRVMYQSFRDKGCRTALCRTAICVVCVSTSNAQLEVPPQRAWILIAEAWCAMVEAFRNTVGPAST